jgi:hypothetical protein
MSDAEDARMAGADLVRRQARAGEPLCRALRELECDAQQHASTAFIVGTARDGQDDETFDNDEEEP